MAASSTPTRANAGACFGVQAAREMCFGGDVTKRTAEATLRIEATRAERARFTMRRSCALRSRFLTGFSVWRVGRLLFVRVIAGATLSGPRQSHASLRLLKRSFRLGSSQTLASGRGPSRCFTSTPLMLQRSHSTKPTASSGLRYGRTACSKTLPSGELPEARRRSRGHALRVEKRRMLTMPLARRLRWQDSKS